MEWTLEVHDEELLEALQEDTELEMFGREELKIN